jgi:hypothetical protein
MLGEVWKEDADSCASRCRDENTGNHFFSPHPRTPRSAARSSPRSAPTAVPHWRHTENKGHDFSPAHVSAPHWHHEENNASRESSFHKETEGQDFSLAHVSAPHWRHAEKKASW